MNILASAIGGVYLLLLFALCFGAGVAGRIVLL